MEHSWRTHKTVYGNDEPFYSNYSTGAVTEVKKRNDGTYKVVVKQPIFDWRFSRFIKKTVYKETFEDKRDLKDVKVPWGEMILYPGVNPDYRPHRSMHCWY